MKQFINYAVHYLDCTEEKPIIAHHYSTKEFGLQIPFEYKTEKELRKLYPDMLLIRVNEKQDELLSELCDRVSQRIHGIAFASWLKKVLEDIAFYGDEWFEEVFGE